LGEDTIEPAHPSGQIAMGGPDEQLVMVGHQAVRQTLPIEIHRHGPEDIEKCHPPLVVLIDCLTPPPEAT
jgi:hypothetical protein